MVIRRGGRLPPSPILMSSAAGRSFSKSYAMPTRSVGAFYPGRSRASSVLHDSRADDYYLFDRVSDVSYLSNATLDTSDDTVRRSRGRDQKLLRDATSAIVSSESYATPQTSVVARRVVRGRSLAPRAASLPPRPYYPNQPRPSDRKIIRTEDGYSKPKNLLSWQYRLDSMINPKDVLYEPASFGRIRSQVRNAQERMDRHRQMIDRYLPEEGEDSTSAKDRVLRKMADMEKHDPVALRSRE